MEKFLNYGKILLECFTFIVIQYLISSAVLSFRGGILFFVFIAAYILVLLDYMTKFENKIKNKNIAYGLLLVSFLVSIFISKYFGYMQMERMFQT